MITNKQNDNSSTLNLALRNVCNVIRAMFTDCDIVSQVEVL